MKIVIASSLSSIRLKQDQPKEIQNQRATYLTTDSELFVISKKFK